MRPEELTGALQRTFAPFLRLPPILRPLLVAVPLVAVAHYVWTIGAEDAGARAALANAEATAAQIAARSAPRFSVGVEQATALITADDSFHDRKRAACPKSIGENEDLSLYPAAKILFDLDYARLVVGISGSEIAMTPRGLDELGYDYADGGINHIIAVGKRQFRHIIDIHDSPPAVDGGTTGATIVTFEWGWQASNHVGERLELNAERGENRFFTGEATLVRRGGVWEVTGVRFNRDTSHDFILPGRMQG